jgi:hypothetical protein
MPEAELPALLVRLELETGELFLEKGDDVFPPNAVPALKSVVGYLAGEAEASVFDIFSLEHFVEFPEVLHPVLIPESHHIQYGRKRLHRDAFYDALGPPLSTLEGKEDNAS